MGGRTFLLSEQNALLMGSLWLACVMVGIRKVGWNALLARTLAAKLED